jgi:hypothetical protein
MASALPMPELAPVIQAVRHFAATSHKAPHSKPGPRLRQPAEQRFEPRRAFGGDQADALAVGADDGLVIDAIVHILYIAAPILTGCVLEHTFDNERKLGAAMTVLRYRAPGCDTNEAQITFATIPQGQAVMPDARTEPFPRNTIEVEVVSCGNRSRQPARY